MIRSILFAAILCSSTAFAQNASDKASGSAGRYQIIAVNIPFGEGKSEQTVFKIDTTTGETWRYMSAQLQIPEDKRLYPQVISASAEGWVPIGEFRKAFDQAVKENEKK
jgi:hypothetical protein